MIKSSKSIKINSFLIVIVVLGLIFVSIVSANQYQDCNIFGNCKILSSSTSSSSTNSNLLNSTDLMGQTSEKTLLTYTPSQNGTYRIGTYLTITAISLDVLIIQVNYTDETSTIRSQNFFAQGLTSASMSSTGAFVYPTMDIRVKANTTITQTAILTTGIGSINYDAGGNIQQII